MSTKPKPDLPVEIIVLMFITLAAICTVVIIFEPALLPMLAKPTPTVLLPVSTPTGQAEPYQPDIIPIATEPSNAVSTVTVSPTSTPLPIFMPTFTPAATNKPVNQLLPDLIVTGISNPICVPGHIGTTTGNYVKFTVIVRNIGRVATRVFGPFDVTISFVLGPRSYTLAEWANKFNGVVGSSNPEIANLNPNEDVALKLEIDIKGNFSFGIQAIANLGAKVIPELDTTNNTLIKYFSIYCY